MKEGSVRYNLRYTRQLWGSYLRTSWGHWFGRSLDALFGYSERPLRLIRAWAVSVLGFGVFIWQAGSVEPSGFWNSLYFSAVSFSALGYGGWLREADTVARVIGAAETFLGVFLLALFVTTFVRRFTR